MPENDFIYFATQGTPNVVPQATYAASSYVGSGQGSGILASPVYNKEIRQGTAGAAMLAQLIVNQLNEAVLDNGNLTTLVGQLTAAIQQAAGSGRPGRIVTSSAALTVNLTDYYIWLQRAAGVAAMNTNLPAGANVGQDFVIQDIQGNMQAYPLTLVPPAGQTIPGGKVLAEDFGTIVATYAGSNLWSTRIM